LDEGIIISCFFSLFFFFSFIATGIAFVLRRVAQEGFIRFISFSYERVHGQPSICLNEAVS
jgi:hypothetical protein